MRGRTQQLDVKKLLNQVMLCVCLESWDGLRVAALVMQIGLQVPRCFRVESAQEVRELNSNKSKLGNKKYLLKSIPYDPSHRADLFTLPCTIGALDK